MHSRRFHVHTRPSGSDLDLVPNKVRTCGTSEGEDSEQEACGRDCTASASLRLGLGDFGNAKSSCRMDGKVLSMSLKELGEGSAGR